MTKSITPARNRGFARWGERLLLMLILAAATGLRLDGVGFGLPALNDPDEPLFMMTALDMLRNHSLNPGWFGHPATITFYSLALVLLAVGGGGVLTGRFADADAFVAAVYRDPGILFLPARWLIVACGVACVWLVYRLGKRLGGTRLGLVGAGFLAVNAVHIHYSQIIRTDVQASVFMLLCTLSALGIVREGRARDYLFAGIWAGLACATKWPAAIIVLNPLCATLYRSWWDRGAARRAVLIPVAAVAALCIASPYLLLDYPTVLRNLAGEARTAHPGANGGGFLANLGWYAANPLLQSFGAAGLALAAVGLVGAIARRRADVVAVAPGALAFLIVIGAQALLWERWVVPLLPFVALAAAAGLCGVADAVRARLGLRLSGVEALAAIALLLPMLTAARSAAVERAVDTRQVASAWVRAHVPPGRSILVEHGAFDLLGGPWRFRFPLGAAGCVDARDILSTQIRYSRVETLRSGRSVVDVAHVDAAQLPGCRADFAVLTHIDGYADDPARFPGELDRYSALIGAGRQVAVIRPVPGARTGPVVRIFQFTR
ncbi:ArnT family glycosyltransferase [Sphingomonas hengshuiensis]|uniref:ArnT family glycosyltransferase n=1 Tax=Sphingomonas hengshuiensis TaxID=1609977 RepID=UPI0005CA87E7|nr:glycosyltransferase family 39 protein [Sphingomonas hengshuiensis]